MNDSFIAPNVLHLWQRLVCTSLRELPHDLSQRQLGILLSVYTTPLPHTVRGLAAELGISKPAITRAIDALSQLHLVQRAKGVADRRNVYIERTIEGTVFLQDFAALILREVTGYSTQLSAS